jgi:hypothetical protein
LSSGIATASRRRWWLWLPLLGVAAWLASFGDKSPNGAAVQVSARTSAVPQGAPRTATSSTAAAAAKLEPIEALERRAAWSSPRADEGPPQRKRDLFATRNWNPPPPAPPVAAKPVPVAPPLPFALVGQKLEGGVWEVYLSRGEETFIAREGQTIAGAYRVDKITPPTLALTYLPLGLSQTLTIGDSR